MGAWRWTGSFATGGKLVFGVTGDQESVRMLAIGAPRLLPSATKVRPALLLESPGFQAAAG